MHNVRLRNISSAKLPRQTFDVAHIILSLMPQVTFDTPQSMKRISDVMITHVSRSEEC